MNLEERIKSFALLGETLRNSLTDSYNNRYNQLNTLINNQYNHNPWFTPENVRRAVTAISEELSEDNLIRWTNSYPSLKKQNKPLKVGVIMAGNIPLAGFHDFLSVLITGNNLVTKLYDSPHEYNLNMQSDAFKWTDNILKNNE